MKEYLGANLYAETRPGGHIILTHELGGEIEVRLFIDDMQIEKMAELSTNMKTKQKEDK